MGNTRLRLRLAGGKPLFRKGLPDPDRQLRPRLFQIRIGKVRISKQVATAAKSETFL